MARKDLKKVCVENALCAQLEGRGIMLIITASHVLMSQAIPLLLCVGMAPSVGLPATQFTV